MAAFFEQTLRMSLLKIFRSDLPARYVGGDCEHRNPVAMTVEKTVDEVKIAGPATACADREVAGKFGIRPGAKRRDLLVTHGHPFDFTVLAQRIGYAVQGVSDQPVYTCYAGGAQDFNESIGHARHDGKLSYCVVSDELSALGFFTKRSPPEAVAYRRRADRYWIIVRIVAQHYRLKWVPTLPSPRTSPTRSCDPVSTKFGS